MAEAAAKDLVCGQGEPSFMQQVALASNFGLDVEVGVFAVFQGTSNGGRHLKEKKRSNRHIVPLSGKPYRLFTQGLKFETR